MGRKIERRRITVDGVVYRYHVRPDDGYIVLLIQREDTRGQRLLVTFGYHDEWVPEGNGVSTSAGHRLVLPRVVRLAILEGPRLGWDPSVKKRPLFRAFKGDDLMPAEEWPRTNDNRDRSSPPSRSMVDRGPDPG